MTDGAIRFGEVDLSTCDREPIHIPGSIQPHGVLLVVDRQRRAIEQVAGDSLGLLGVAPGAALEQPIADVLGADQEIRGLHRVT